MPRGRLITYAIIGVVALMVLVGGGWWRLDPAGAAGQGLGGPISQDARTPVFGAAFQESC